MRAGWRRVFAAIARIRSGNWGKRPAALPLSPGGLVALAYPDRVARARGKAGDFLMANGRAASVEPHLALARAKFLAVAEVAGRAGASRILAAAELDEATFETLFAGQIESEGRNPVRRGRAAPCGGARAADSAP